METLKQTADKKIPEESSAGSTHYFTNDKNNLTVDIYKLIHLSEVVPVQIVPISTLASQANDDCWNDSLGNKIGPHRIMMALADGKLSWAELLRDRPEWQTHVEGVRDANYEKYPLLVVEDNQIADGMHRLTKALIDKVTEIKVKRFLTTPVEAIVINNKSDTVEKS